ncbi:MAG: Rieske 2Fe-2S domain-containing protein [Acidimicrobiales bacterium]
MRSDPGDTTMLVSEIPALREYWYPVAYGHDLAAGPRRAQLFGEGIVLWRNAAGLVRASVDACPHRGARLSQGWRAGTCMVCPYHGWQFDGDDGSCVRIPQNPAGSAVPRRARLAMVHADERYGLVWLCVAERPREAIPTLPELEDPSFTLVHELMEEWSVCAPRCVDNALDVSHLSFVHRNTVGNSARPEMSDYTVERDGLRVRFSISYEAQVTEEMKRNTGLTVDVTTRTTHAELVQPLVFRGVLEYENGLRHVLYKTAAPLDDHRTLFCQFIARNDHPDEDRQRLMAEIDRRIQAEDRALLEGLTSEFPVEVGTEVHTKADRMTLEYRRVLASLAAEAGPLRPDATWDPFARRNPFAGKVISGKVEA